jgi:hypothetical protein
MTAPQPPLGELTPDDVEQYTGGRLSADDDETQRMLTAILVAARRACGWHVSPVKKSHTITLNGPHRGLFDSGRELILPTQYVQQITAVTSDGVALDPAVDVKLGVQDPNQPSPVGVKLYRVGGCWSHCPAGITVTMDHGFDPAGDETGGNAADWRQAILDMVDDLDSIKKVGRADTSQILKQVDDWRGQWNPAASLPENNAIIQQFSLTLGGAFA